MRRILGAFCAAIVLTLATTLPVAGSGLSDVTVSCNDGSSWSATVDGDTLAGIADSLQAMALFPAGLSCSLATVPVILPLGSVASAWPGGGFIVGGGRFMAGCPGPLGGMFWVNFGLSARTVTDAAGDTRGGTLNFTIPAGQCVGPSHLTSKPTCLKINAEQPKPPQGAWFAWIRSRVTQTSGSFWAGAEGTEFGSGWKDTGNPGHQLSPDREADHQFSSCPNDGFPNPDDALISHAILNGNVTIHAAE
jgi:hypothetical protein